MNKNIESILEGLKENKFRTELKVGDILVYDDNRAERVAKVKPDVYILVGKDGHVSTSKKDVIHKHIANGWCNVE